MNRKIFILIILITKLCSLELYSQIKGIDSLESLLEQHTQNDTIRVNLLNKTALKVYLVDFDKTLLYATEAYNIADKLGFAKGKAKSLRYIGIHYYMKANYAIALDYYQKALKAETELNNLKEIGRCNNNIGMIYMYLSNFDLSLEYLQKAMKVGNEVNDKIGISLFLNNMGNTYRAMNDYSKALEYYLKALDIKIKLDNKIGIAGSYHNIGKNYKFMNNYDKSLEYLHKSLIICHEIGNKSIEARNYTELASVYLKKGKIKEAYNYSKKAYILSKEIGEKNFQKQSSEIIAKTCETMGLYKEAYKYSVIFKAINDSIYNDKNIKKIAEIESKYKYEKEIEITALKQQKKDAITAEDKRQQKIISLFFIVAFVLMILIASLIFRNLVQKRKANYVLEKQKEEIYNQAEELKELNATKDKFFTIIAHDLKGPFNSILGFSNILEKNYKILDDEEREKYIKYISISSTKIYKLLTNLLTWSREQTGKIKFSPEKLSLRETIDEGILLQFESAKNKSIKLKANIETDLLVHVDKNMLSTIIRNLVSNAIKFTPKNGEISVNAKEIVKENNQKFIQVTVKDTGVGISKEMQAKIFDISKNTTTKGTENELGTGLGLILSKEFVEKHGGKIWIESEKEKGSEFIFTLPVNSF